MCIKLSPYAQASNAKMQRRKKKQCFTYKSRCLNKKKTPWKNFLICSFVLFQAVFFLIFSNFFFPCNRNKAFGFAKSKDKTKPISRCLKRLFNFSHIPLLTVKKFFSFCQVYVVHIHTKSL